MILSHLKIYPKSIRHYSVALNYLYSIDSKCRSCGIKLQTSNPNQPGFYIKHSPKQKVQRSDDSIYDRYKSKLSSSDIDYNTRITSSPSQAVKDVYKLPSESSIECIRCRQVQNQSRFNLSSNEEYPIMDLNHIMTHMIPKNSPIVYLFNSLDFPMGLNRDIFKYRSPKDILFIMTKSDNLINSPSSAYESYTEQFLTDYLSLKYQVPIKNIFITSGIKNWNSKNLLNFIPDHSYIIGNTNCGKSTLIKSLLLNSNLNRIKRQNIQIPFGIEQRQRSKYITQFNSKVGPGVSFLPGYTRDIIPIDISNEKTIFDVPGFHSNRDILQFYQFLSNGKLINQIFKGGKLYKKGKFDSFYFTVKNRQILNLQGIGFINVPKGSIYQIRNVTNLNCSIVKDLQKLQSLSLSVPVEFQQNFVAPHQNLNELNKFIIPPFYGSIDLVIENIGYINIKPTGSKSSNELIEIYLQKGLNCIIRQPLMQYLSKSLSGKDKNYNPLNKKNLVGKSTIKLKRYDNTTPFYSRLVPCNEEKQSEIIDEDEKRLRNYKILSDEFGVIYDDEIEMNESNKYTFWRED